MLRSKVSGKINDRRLRIEDGDPRFSILGSLMFWTFLLAVPLPGFGQEKIEGTVITTNLISCSVVPGKVGTCEGTLVLESKADGKPRQMTVKITRDTALKKGDEKIFLFQLQGAPVSISFVTEKGEKMAQSVLMKPQK